MMVFNHPIIALVAAATLELSPFATRAQDYLLHRITVWLRLQG